MADARTFGGLTIIAAALGALLGGGNAQAQTPRAGDEVFIANSWSDPARCNLGRARRVAFDALVRDYRAIRGRCVAVHGYKLGSGLFLSVRDARASGAHYSRDGAGRRIGLYGRREIMDLGRAEASLVTAVGLLGSCETLGDHSVTVMGYCHSIAEGPYLALAGMYSEPVD